MDPNKPLLEGSPSIICEYCGGANPPQASFCFSCGHPFARGSGSLTGLLAPGPLLKQRYRVLSQIGKGGFGAVYVSEDTQLDNRLVAIKEMSQRGLSAKDFQQATEALRREGELLSGLKHPSLPAIYDHFSENGRWYLAMEYIDGETLEERLAKTPDGRLPLSETLQIGLQLCKVLDYLHQQQPPIIFRDLKPANIMLTPQGSLYLIDFGIARLFKPGQVKDTTAIGSIGYAAPEQYGKAQTTTRSDIYSLGATMHHLLSGNNPSDHPLLFAPLNLTQPAGLEPLIMQMVERDHLKRPTSIREIQQQLQQMMDGQPEQQQGSSQKRRWSAVLTAALKQQLKQMIADSAIKQQSSTSFIWSRYPSFPVRKPLRSYVQPVDPSQSVPGALLVMVVCPLCHQQHLYPLTPGYSDLFCPHKRKPFLVLFAKTRTARTHTWRRPSNLKIYQIQIILPNNSERQIDFASREAHFELQAGDDIIIAYNRGRARIIMHPARHRYMLSAY
jgi:serine/threonine protein kinase